MSTSITFDFYKLSKFINTKKLQEVRERKYYTKKSTKRKLTKEKAILKRKYKEENDE